VDFAVKKAENCFSDAENYEYRIAMTGAEFIAALKNSPAFPGEELQVKINEALRRPTFFATLPNGTCVKGLIGKNVIKTGYVVNQATEQRQAFEAWLDSL
jgi:hypothetical protein